MAGKNEILKDALNLRPAEKAELVDKLLSSLNNPENELDELWAKEAEECEVIARNRFPGLKNYQQSAS